MELGEGMHGVGWNRGRACMGWGGIGEGHAWGGIEWGEGMHGVGWNRGRACMGWDIR